MNEFFGLLAVVALSIVAIVAMTLGKATGISFFGLKIGVSKNLDAKNANCGGQATPYKGKPREKSEKQRSQS